MNYCECNDDQGAGYTFHDEYGLCDFCLNILKKDHKLIQVCPDCSSILGLIITKRTKGICNRCGSSNSYGVK
jgi:hypothetical protein